MSEEWRLIEQYPGGYEVSRDGRVRNRRGKELQLFDGGSGYMAVNLRGNRSVHQLVAAAFHGPRPRGEVVRHLDGDKLNNNAENLAYGTQAENVDDSIRHGTFTTVGLEAGWARNRSRESCSAGHPLVAREGLSGGRRRWCPLCHRARVAESTRRWAARRKAAEALR